MGKRLDLDAQLRSIMTNGNVYFQPPANIQIKYPCIIYSRDSALSNYADNSSYRYTKRYQVTVIDRDPDSEFPDKVAHLPLCSFSRHFTSDNLHHDAFNIYF